jgi:hypothetical protein
MTRVAMCRLLAGLYAWAAASLAVAGDDGPDWFQRSAQPLTDLDMQSADEFLVVLQRDRVDGPDLLTLRYTLGQIGPLFTYAGAGINRTSYIAWTVDPTDGLLGRSRHRAIGAAAELGAAWRVSNSLALAADVHWVDLASNADMLRVGNSMIAADAVALGVSLGWRFK